MTEVYNSSTHGPIPLSFEGRRLMQNLRYAIQGAISQAIVDARKSPYSPSSPYSHNDNAIAKARGELVKYISRLEGRNSQNLLKPHPNFVLDLEAQPDIEDRSARRVLELLEKRIELVEQSLAARALKRAKRKPAKRARR